MIILVILFFCVSATSVKKKLNKSQAFKSTRDYKKEMFLERHDETHEKPVVFWIKLSQFCHHCNRNQKSK